MNYRYCPQCRAEYRPAFGVCADCGLDLVDELPPEPPVSRNSSVAGLGVTATEVWRGLQEVNAHIIQSMLQANGVDAEVWAAGLGANIPEDLAAHRVMVKSDQVEQAEYLIATSAD